MMQVRHAMGRLIICKVRLWCPAGAALSEMRHRYPKYDTDVCLTPSGGGVSGDAQDAGEGYLPNLIRCRGQPA